MANPKPHFMAAVFLLLGICAPSLWAIEPCELVIENAVGEWVQHIQVPLNATMPASLVPRPEALIMQHNQAPQGVLFDVGATLVAWHGYDAHGLAVPNGVYTVRLACGVSPAAKTLAVTTLMVMQAQESSLLEGLQALPTHLSLSQQQDVVLSYQQTQGVSVTAKVYRSNGDLLANLEANVGAGPVALVLNAKAHRLSEGVYHAVFWAHAPWGKSERKVVSFSVGQ
jgi:hypothetical protein